MSSRNFIPRWPSALPTSWTRWCFRQAGRRPQSPQAQWRARTQPQHAGTGEGLAHPFSLHDGRVVVATAAAELGATVIASMPPDPFVGHEAAKDTYIEARDRRILEDNRRQIAEAEQRQRESRTTRGRRDGENQGGRSYGPCRRLKNRRCKCPTTTLLRADAPRAKQGAT